MIIFLGWSLRRKLMGQQLLVTYFWGSSYSFVPPIRHRHVLFPFTLDRAWEDFTSVCVILFTWTVVRPRSLICHHDNTPRTRQLTEERLISAHGSILAGMVTGGMVAGAEAEDAQFEPQVQSRESELQMAYHFNPQSSLVTPPPTGLYKREKLHIQTTFVH